MARQLTFDLPARPALGRDDFFVSPANTNAVATIDDWQNWPLGKLVLAGPRGAGKTHLAHVWAAEANAAVLSVTQFAGQDVAALVASNRHIAIEDIDQVAGNADAEVALFHLHNLILGEGGRLLMTAVSAPTAWPITLPDLASRMQGTHVVALAAPDDPLLLAVLVKLFADRQLAVSPAVLTYLVSRMERSFQGAQSLVAALDIQALSEGRAVSQRLAAGVLDNLPQPGAS
jgi:chromosomal replication initiation ATPase DnaA